jgi:polysaccharide export outer membrane protein
MASRETSRARSRETLAVLALLVSVLSSCARTPRAADVDPGAPRDAADERARVHSLWTTRSPNGVVQDICLGPGDLIEITVLGWQEMQSFRTRITPSGTISLPIVGAIQASGLTENQLRDRVSQKLGEKVLRDPQVTIFVAEHPSQQVSVTGAVARPGLVDLTRENRTVQDLISEAGGLSENSGGTVMFYPANAKPCTPGASPTALLARPVPTGDDADAIEIDLNGNYQPPQENPLFLPVIGGDAIVVNRGRFLVDGWVKTPGAYDITPGMTALGGLSAAGGAMFPADLSSVTVWRSERGGTKRTIPLDFDAIRDGHAKDLTLQAGDVIQVPVSAVKLVPYSGYWVLTNVIRVGAGFTMAGF